MALPSTSSSPIDIIGMENLAADFNTPTQATQPTQVSLPKNALKRASLTGAKDEAPTGRSSISHVTGVNTHSSFPRENFARQNSAGKSKGEAPSADKT